MIGVYHIVNTKTGKRYIGSSVDIECRLKAHQKALANGSHYNNYLQRAWDKWGENAFLWLVYQCCEDGSKALELEQEQLNLFETIGRWDELYNVSKDAISPTRGQKLSDEHRRKLSEAHKGKKQSDEHRRKLSEAAKKRPPRLEESNEKSRQAMLGRKASEESRAKMSQAQKGKSQGPLSEAHKRKISEANKGKSKPPRTEEHKSKLGRKGKKLSEETKRKMSEAQRARRAYNREQSLPNSTIEENSHEQIV